MAPENGTTVRVHYRGTLDDGSEFDNSHPRGEPIEFVIGAGSVITGFDDAVRGMAVGDTLSVKIPADNAYGQQVPEAVQRVKVEQLPDGAYVGAMLQAMTEDGHPLAGSIIELGDEFAVVDFNHPLAGQDLTFELELVEIVEG